MSCLGKDYGVYCFSNSSRSVGSAVRCAQKRNRVVEYSEKVHVGLPLAAQAENCRRNPAQGDSTTQVVNFKVYMISYGNSDCCIDKDCGSIGRLVASWGGTVLMTQSMERAYSFGVRTIADEAGEHLADRLVVVTGDDTKVKGIFRNLDSHDLEVAMRCALRRPLLANSRLAIFMDHLHAWASNVPRRL